MSSLEVQYFRFHRFTFNTFSSDITESITLLIRCVHIACLVVNPDCTTWWLLLPCIRHIVVQKLSHTNLILVVVDILCSQNIWQEVRITKVEVSGSDIFCLKARNDELARKKPKTCVGRDKTGMVRQPY